MRASGSRPSFSAAAAEATTSAAAPSLMPEALPAVTVPSFLKAGLSLASLSSEVWRGCSSVSNSTGSPLRCGTSTATISSLKRPAAMAASARCWLRRPNSSCSSRPSP